jgi:pimeloyl-ACP methyl ester carboxylesterase
VSEPAFRSREVRVEGVRSPVLEGGHPSAPEAVVFLHGNPGSSRDWEMLVYETSRFGRAVALDMPGFGRADKPARFDYTVEGYARHLRGALGELGIERAHLVLHDFGGPWGLAWAAAHPARFASAVLINTGALPGYRWHAWARIWRTPVLGELVQTASTRRGFHLAIRRGNPGLPRAFLDRMYDEYDRRTRRAVLALYRATDPALLGEELRARLRPLARPALVVWGRRDPYISPRYAERQRESFPDCEIVMLEKSGHWPFMDDPRAVADAVLPFLRRQLRARGSG